MEKVIELTPLAEMGRGSARVSDTSVEIQVSGICGGMKAWLIGGEAESIGNLVDGRLYKNIDTTKHDGILITQTGRQMFIGRYAEEVQSEPLPVKEEEEAEQEGESVPFEIDGFNWKKITQKSYADFGAELRYLLSNRSVYENYKKHGHYWIGESSGSSALGLPCADEEDNPLAFIKGKKLFENGYVIVCVDKETKKLYIPKEQN